MAWELARVHRENIDLRAALISVRKDCEIYQRMTQTSNVDDEIKIGGTA